MQLILREIVRRIRRNVNGGIGPCAGYLRHLFIDRDVREHDLARITHRLHTEMPCQESEELASRYSLNIHGDLWATRQRDGMCSSFVKENGPGNAPTPSLLDTTML